MKIIVNENISIKVFVILTIFVITLSIAILYSATKGFIEVNILKRCNKVEAQITYSTAEKTEVLSETSYQREIEYIYNVNDKEYKGKDILWWRIFVDFDYNIKVGDKIIVFYNIDNPTISEVYYVSYVLIIISLCCIVISILALKQRIKMQTEYSTLKKKIESQKNTNSKNILIKKQNGITLVALVVSIIVMLVLAGVSLNATIGENGIISRAQESKLSKEEADVETEILSGVAALDTEYYEKVSADSGITINSIYSISELSKYVKGKINGFSYNKDGKSTVYYTNEMGSYTVVIDKNGQAKTYSGIYLEKNQISSIQMDKNDKITLITDIEDVVWAVVSGDATVNPTTGEVVKNGNGTIIIKGADTNGNEVTVIIKDNTENNVAKNTDVTNAIETANINDNVVAYIIPGEDGNNKLVIKGNGNIEDVENLRNMTNANTVTEIVIEEGIKEILNWPFINFFNTKIITIPKSVTFLGGIGSGLKKLVTINYNAINAEAPNIGTFTGFNDAKNLQNVNIGEEVESLPWCVFYGCKFNNIVIPNSVKSIGDSAFSNCENLLYVKLGNSLKTIGYKAFAYSSIQNITIPESVEKIGQSAFSNCSNLEKVTYNAINCEYDGVADYVYSLFYMNGDNGNDVLQEIVIGNKVEKIPEGMFSFINKVNKIEIPESVKIIEQRAFLKNKGIKTLILNNGLKEIGICAFDNTNIKEITIPESVEKIGQSAFEYCNNLEKVTYNAINCEYDGVADYVYPLFYMDGGNENDVLQEIVIGNKVKKIPEGMFSFINKVNKIEIPQSVKDIEQRAFLKSKGIKTLILNNGIEKIGNKAFSEIGIKKLTLPESLKYIGEWAFWGCNDIETLYYNSIHCSTKLIFENEFNNSRYPFQSNDNEDIGKCYNIENIIIGDKVEYLDSDIFRKCNITTITIPSSVKYIAYEGGNQNSQSCDTGTFYNCNFLKEIIVKKTENSIVGAPWSNVSGITVKWEP